MAAAVEAKVEADDPELFVYQFKITLKRSKPEIWRRIQVPGKYNFYEFHVAIQNAMGWQLCHLHQFSMKNPKTKKNVVIGELDGYVDRINERTTKIASFFLIKKDKANYEYDFGDGWNHEVILEEILPAVFMDEYPKCLDGKMACPPEDCGGIFGYEALKKIMANPKHKEYADRMEWLGGQFDPVTFDPKMVYFWNPEFFCEPF